MSSTAIKRAAYNLMHESTKPLSDIAEWLHKSPYTLRAEVNPNIATAKLGLDDAIDATVFTGNLALLTAFAAEVNCVLLQLPGDDIQAAGPVDLSKLTRDFSAVLTSLSKPAPFTPNDMARAETAVSALFATMQQGLRHVAGASAMTRGHEAWVPA